MTGTWNGLDGYSHGLLQGKPTVPNSLFSLGLAVGKAREVQRFTVSIADGQELLGKS